MIISISISSCNERAKQKKKQQQHYFKFEMNNLNFFLLYSTLKFFFL